MNAPRIRISEWQGMLLRSWDSQSQLCYILCFFLHFKGLRQKCLPAIRTLQSSSQTRLNRLRIRWVIYRFVKTLIFDENYLEILIICCTFFCARKRCMGFIFLKTYFYVALSKPLTVDPGVLQRSGFGPFTILIMICSGW